MNFSSASVASVPASSRLPASGERSNGTTNSLVTCPNPMIGKVVGEMRNRIHHLANAVNQMSPKRIVECTEEHRRIVDAIAARDEERAEQMMLAHIQQLRASIFDRLSYS
jgi:DNA-binding FadR family transcriptional regulator